MERSQKLTARPPKNGWLGNDFPFGKPYFQVLLLMEEILHHPGMYKPLSINNGRFSISTGDRRISEPSTGTVSFRESSGTPVNHREGLHLAAAVIFSGDVSASIPSTLIQEAFPLDGKGSTWSQKHDKNLR